MLKKQQFCCILLAGFEVRCSIQLSYGCIDDGAHGYHVPKTRSMVISIFRLCRMNTGGFVGGGYSLVGMRHPIFSACLKK
jgi:hypothetical protein